MNDKSTISFGKYNSDGSTQEGYIDEDGQMKYNDLRTKWFNCKVIDRYTKNRWIFSGRNYYIVLQIEGLNPNIFTICVNEQEYYSYKDGSIKMYSINGHTWKSHKDYL